MRTSRTRPAPRSAMPLLPLLPLLCLLLVLAACGQGSTTPGGPAGAPPSEPASAAPRLPAEGLVLRVEHVGGFVTPTMLAARLPVVSVYADGRVITEGPQIAIYPPPALPNLLVRQVDPAAVPSLVQLALDAGAGEGLDLGQPPIADATTTRVVVVTADGREVLEAYALAESPGLEEPGALGPQEQLTAEQRAAREELRALLDALADLPATLGQEAVGPEEPYRPEAVAAVVTPWVDPGEGQPELVQPEVPWPGPPLPGEPLVPALDVTCLTATGEQAQAVLAAAATASAATPWVQDGQRWSVTLRPLLPDETGCQDLLGRG